MARRTLLSENTVTIALSAVEMAISNPENSLRELDVTQQLFDARRELNALAQRTTLAQRNGGAMTSARTTRRARVKATTAQPPAID